MATPDEFDAVIAFLTAAYPMLSIPRATMNLYEEELADVPAKYLLEAARAHIKRCRFFPSISELRGPYDERREEEARAKREREWKRKLDSAKQEALPKPKARKMLTALTEAASGNGAAIVPFRGGQMKRILADKPKPFVIAETDEEFEEKRRKAKEVVSR